MRNKGGGLKGGLGMNFPIKEKQLQNFRLIFGVQRGSRGGCKVYRKNEPGRRGSPSMGYLGVKPRKWGKPYGMAREGLMG